MIAGISSLQSVRRKDRENFIVHKATPLSLELANVHDDVWLTGKPDCAEPLTSPHFGYSCLYYEYKLYEKVRRGIKRKVEWKELERSSASASFLLHDGEHSIHINGAQAKFESTKGETANVGSYRHIVDYFPYSSLLAISAVGSISDGKERLEPRANIPLMITSQGRRSYVRAAERRELTMRVFGFLAFLFGMIGVLLTSLTMYGAPPHIMRLALIAPPIVVALYWIIFKYNTMVNYRNRVNNTWRQIDVDLTMRYELIPKLAECAKGIMKHEREVIERLSSLRVEASANRGSKLHLEGQVATSVGQAVALFEDYPDLKAQDSVSHVMDEMRAIEEKIAHARSVYNAAVEEYNSLIRSFPHLLIASLFDFRKMDFFSMPEKARHGESEL